MATQEEVDNLFRSPLPNPPPDASTFTPQEQYLRDWSRQNGAMPEAKNPDGTNSSLLAFTRTFDDKTYILPSIWNGARLSTEDATNRAMEHGLEKFPSYGSVNEAEARYKTIHGILEQDQSGQAGAAADVRKLFEEQAQHRRSVAIGEQQKNPGIFGVPGVPGTGMFSPGGTGMEEPGYHPEGPKAAEAERWLAEQRGAAHAKGRLNQWDNAPNYMRAYADALAQGYTLPEIDAEVAKMKDEARRVGWSEDQINLYLTGTAPRQYNGSEKPNPTAGRVGDFLMKVDDAVFGPHNSNYAPSMGLQTPGAFTGGAYWKQLGWNIWDALKVFPEPLVGGPAAIAELSDGTEKTDGETAKLLSEVAMFGLMIAPWMKGMGRTLPKFGGSGALEGEIIPPGPRGGPIASRGPGPVIEGEYRVMGQDLAPVNGGFPTYDQFFSGAVKFAQTHPDGYNPNHLPVILRQMGDHFVATGDHPLQTAMAHPNYGSFLAQIERLKQSPIALEAQDSVARTPSGLMEPHNEEAARAEDFAGQLVKGLDAGDFANMTQDQLLDHAMATFKQLMADEQGAIKWPFWRTDISPDEMFRPDPLKYGELVNNLRAIFNPAGMAPRLAGKAKATMAWSALETERMVHSLQQYGRYVGELSDPMRVQMIAAYQRGLMDVIENNRSAFERQYPLGSPMRTMADNYLQPGSPLFGFFKEMRFYSDQAWKDMDSMPGGSIAPGYVFNYFPGQWREFEAARALWGKGKLGNTGKRFTREKSIPDIEAGMQMGLTPVSTNPINVMVARLATQQKYIRDFKVFRAFEADGAILPEDQVTPDMRRDGWVPAPNYFTLPGEKLMQKYVHPDAARLLSAMTDSGWAKHSLYRMLRQAANFVTSVNLAGPGFHSTFVTLDAMSTDMALATQELSRVLMNPEKGMWSEAGQAGLSMLRSPLAPILNVRAGMAMKKLAANPGINAPTIMGLPRTAVSDALKNYMEGGGRMGLEDIYKSSRQGSFWPALKAQFKPSEGHATFTQEIAEMARDTIGDVRIAGAFKVPAWTALMGARLLARMGDTLSAPLMGYYVPALKAGTFYRHMESAMRVAPNMGGLEIQRVAGNISSMIDNRYGEMVYDNKFWNAYAKTSAQLGFRAWGFNYGALDTIAVGGREIASSIVGRPDRLREPLPTINATTGQPDVSEIRQLGSKGAALIGMVMFTVLAGALIGVGEGTWNEDWKPYDYLYPKLANGQRIKLPSHMNNAYEFYNHPGQSFRNRINGLWVMGYDQLRNTQWDDRTPIVPPSHESGEGPTRTFNNPEALQDRYDYWQHGMWPYAVQQLYNPTPAQQEIDPALRLLGVGPAPWEIREPDRAKKFDAKQAKERQKAWEYQQRKKRQQEQK